jgi:acetylornithine deacetylase/succinyl-diaminopimelate desuccinylase-like protein
MRWRRARRRCESGSRPRAARTPRSIGSSARSSATTFQPSLVEASPALDRVLGALVGRTFQPSLVEASPAQNVVPGRVTLTIACGPLPGTTEDQLAAELREALGEGDYELQISTPPTSWSSRRAALAVARTIGSRK